MRVLKLSNQQIETICRALGIAESSFNRIRKQYIEELITVRSVDSVKTVKEETSSMFNKENEFCDLLLAIKDFELDVKN